MELKDDGDFWRIRDLGKKVFTYAAPLHPTSTPVTGIRDAGLFALGKVSIYSRAYHQRCSQASENLQQQFERIQSIRQGAYNC